MSITDKILAGVGIAAGALLLLNACGPYQAKADELDKISEQVFTPSVQIGDYCSGTMIHSGRDDASGKVETVVLTAKHCTEKVDEKLEVVIHKYDKTNRLDASTHYKSKVKGQFFKGDLAFIQLEDTETFFKTVAKIAPKDIPLKFGQDVITVGYPLGRSLTYTKGNLGYVENDIDDWSTSGEFYRATPDVGPGNSGGGMFTKNAAGDYVLIGVTTGGFRGLTFMNFYTPIEEINEYLDVALKTLVSKNKKEEEKTNGTEPSIISR